ncbi:uncharacterized protein [Littorina saxatilis]|uniref:CARD domain-containing protein n=1 Tax=Littorina saxatilis TaxID=31220 RepID=A0AAN9B568_9CAEN
MEKDSGESTDQPAEITKHVFTNLEKFLLAIHARFLEIVDPIESGLIDILRQDNVLGCDEEEEIRAEATRINKARKCWNILQAVQPAVFQRHCFPALNNRFPHVLQEAVFCWDRARDAAKLCLRHVIKKTCLRRFADVFVMTGACSHDEYCTVTEGCPDRTKWDLVFRLCAKNGENAEFVQQVKTKLMSFQVEIPDNFHTSLSTGFPCECTAAANASQKKKKIGKSKKARRVKRQLEKCIPIDEFSISAIKHMKLEHDSKSEACESSSVYPPSSADDTRDKGNGSASISSGTTGQTVKAEVSDHEMEETQFETEEQKETYLLEMEQTNKAVTKACSIRSLSRELAGIKEELSTLREKAKSESETSTNRAFLNDGKIYRLHDRARSIYQTLKQNYEEVSELKRKIAAEELTFDFEIPFTRKKVLLERRHMLVSEVTEATSFLQQAESLYPTMSIPEKTKPATCVPVTNMFSPSLPWDFDDDDFRDIFEDENDLFEGHEPDDFDIYGPSPDMSYGEEDDGGNDDHPEEEHEPDDFDIYDPSPDMSYGEEDDGGNDDHPEEEHEPDDFDIYDPSPDMSYGEEDDGGNDDHPEEEHEPDDFDIYDPSPDMSYGEEDDGGNDDHPEEEHEPDDIDIYDPSPDMSYGEEDDGGNDDHPEEEHEPDDFDIYDPSPDMSYGEDDDGGNDDYPEEEHEPDEFDNFD